METVQRLARSARQRRTAIIFRRAQDGPGQFSRQPLARLCRDVEHVARSQQVPHRRGHVQVGSDDHHAGKGVIAAVLLRGRNGGSKGRQGRLADLGDGNGRHHKSEQTISLYQFSWVLVGANNHSPLPVKTTEIAFIPFPQRRGSLTRRGAATYNPANSPTLRSFP